MSKLRIERIQELYKEEVGAMLLKQEIKDPRIGFVTVTDVQVTPDLRYAKFYVSPFGGEEAERQTMEGLESAKGYIRTELGRRIRLRYTPEVLFAMDKSIERGIRMTRLIDEVNQKEEKPQ